MSSKVEQLKSEELKRAVCLSTFQPFNPSTLQPFNLLTICLLCAFAPIRLQGQSAPALPSVSFAWEEPRDLAGIFAYRLQWRTGQVILPVTTTNETIQYFPSGFAETVGISSMATQGESPTNEIKVMSVLAHFQSDRGDGAGWRDRTSLWFVVQLESNEMFRVKLEARP